MIRKLILGCAIAALSLTGAAASHAADALVERGAYLMNGIVACGNCHNTRSPDMRFICQTAFNIDPRSACKIDPPERHGGGCPGSQ